MRCIQILRIVEYLLHTSIHISNGKHIKRLLKPTTDAKIRLSARCAVPYYVKWLLLIKRFLSQFHLFNTHVLCDT